MITFQFNDGGRSNYFKGNTGDCVTRAIAIATGKDYKEVYDDLNKLAKEKGRRGSRKVKTKYGTSYVKASGCSRTGHFRKTYQPYLESLGWKWVSCSGVGKGISIHLKEDELPKGKIICSVSRHLCTVIDGVLHDTYDCSREGTRGVYGYFIKIN